MQIVVEKHVSLNIKRIVKIAIFAFSFSLFSLNSQAKEFVVLETIGCPVYPSKDIKIDEQFVTLSENNQIWQIAKDGAVTLNGKIIQLSESGTSSAKKYQQTLRNELPEFYATTQNLIDSNLGKLDAVIEKTLGEKSKLRNTIKELKPVIQEEFALILNKEEGGALRLSLSNLKEINSRIQELVAKHSKPIMQETLSEIATNQLFGKKENKVSLAEIQDELKATFAGENIKAKELLKQACTAFEEWGNLEADFINEKTLDVNQSII
ncbi:DUF2884 family protein [Thorsellia kenyensis]|uniref:DUF2884 family protein n=1 Tax=Thorsellia kenyensis TaxID=1549888 RepID=A0ABV6CCI1_9GAMM